MPDAAEAAFDAAANPGPERFRVRVAPGCQYVYLPGDPALSFSLR